MSGKTKDPAKALTQIYFLINMKKMLPFAPQLISSALVVQFLGSASLLEFLKKSGESGEVFFLRMEKFLESFLSTGVKINGLKLGRV